MDVLDQIIERARGPCDVFAGVCGVTGVKDDADRGEVDRSHLVSRRVRQIYSRIGAACIDFDVETVASLYLTECRRAIAGYLDRPRSPRRSKGISRFQLRAPPASPLPRSSNSAMTATLAAEGELRSNS